MNTADLYNKLHGLKKCKNCKEWQAIISDEKQGYCKAKDRKVRSYNICLIFEWIGSTNFD